MGSNSKENRMPLVALAGNPNTGKSTLFNRLSGLRQRVGNYPGVTVECKLGTTDIAGERVRIVDLPGTYSLSATSLDELVVVDALTGKVKDLGVPDLIVFVADASNLQRNLFLASQIADLGLPVVIAANMADSAEAQGLKIDFDTIAARLGVPVVPTVASAGEGIELLKESIAAALEHRPAMQTPAWPESVEKATDELSRKVQEHCNESLTPAFARRLIFDAKPIAAGRLSWEPELCTATLGGVRADIQKSGLHPLAAESLLTHRHLQQLLSGAIEQAETSKQRFVATLDKILLHRVFGLAIFMGIMFLVFQAIYAWSGPLMDMIDGLCGALQEVVAPLLAWSPAFQDLVVTGIIGGVGGVLIFLPQICILFLFIAILEDSGYMARAAFLMDRLFSWCGLNGKSFIPMLSSYACAVPGVMACRTIEDPKARLTTILTAPLMSCSARLPVYVLLIAAFIAPTYGAKWAGIALFAMHFVGLAVAIPVAWVVNKLILKTPSQPFVLEIPPYRKPVLRDVFLRVFERGKSFTVRAGTVILAMSVIIWFLLYFPRPDGLEQTVRRDFIAQSAPARGVTTERLEELLAAKPDTLPEDTAVVAEELQASLENRITGAQLEQSYLARFGKTIQPVFEPAGYDWKITVGVLASFPAREVIIATLGIIYNLGDEVDEEHEGLKSILQRETWTDGVRAGTAVYSVPVAFSIMVFFALCMQCGATVATIWRETSWKWAAFTFIYMTVLAWIGAVVTYQIGTHLT